MLTPIEALTQYLHTQKASQYCVAYSGGMDSHVLLHAATELLQDEAGIELRAIHIDHGLNPDSQQWVTHAEFVCDALGVELVSRRVNIDAQEGGPEAGARLARYEAFADIMHHGEQLLLAQHADDQAETFLLQALRGSGPDGLASIPRKRTFARGFMARPLLACPQEALSAYAKAKGLSWIEDPSNVDTRFDRNFIRKEILPLLRTRWPAATQTLSRSAMRSAAASQAMQEIAKKDLKAVKVGGSSELSIAKLNELPKERRYSTIRLWVRQSSYRMPRLQDLKEVCSSLLEAREDSAGVVNARDYEFRRHRDRLYLLAKRPEIAPYSMEWPAPYNDIFIEQAGQLLTKKACLKQGIVLPDEGSVTVSSRQGGELIRLGEPAFHKSVKKVLQEAAVPPWQRDTIPLIYINNRLAAVWNIAVAADFSTVTELA